MPSGRVTKPRPGDNPFRSARVDALAYRPPEAGGIEAIEAAWGRHHFRGALVGPHGHGKTTLMHELVRRYERKHAGSAVRVVQVSAEHGWLSPALRYAVRDRGGLLVVDGVDLLGPVARWRLRRRRGALLVTTHRAIGLPTIAVCRTTPRLLGELVDELSPTASAALGDAEIQALWQRHDGNVRRALRELYDRCADGEFAVHTFSDAASPRFAAKPRR
jgi:hypothetical protein